MRIINAKIQKKQVEEKLQRPKSKPDPIGGNRRTIILFGGLIHQIKIAHAEQKERVGEL